MNNSQVLLTIVALVGVVIGLALGLWYTWFVNPVEYDEVAPDMLGEEERHTYLALVAQTYVQDGDLERARRRIEVLGQGRGIAELVAAHADLAFERGEPLQVVQALAVLAEGLGGQPQVAAQVFSGTLVPGGQTLSPTPSPTFRPTSTPQPTPTYTSQPTEQEPGEEEEITLTPGPPTAFELTDRQVFCDPRFPNGALIVRVFDAEGEGVPGAEVMVEWEGGEDHFFTGLKPDIGAGYADFETEPDGVYTVTLVGCSQPVVSLDVVPCTTDDGQPGNRAYRLTFEPGEPESD
jgi:hypothetical protein